MKDITKNLLGIQKANDAAAYPEREKLTTETLKKHREGLEAIKNRRTIYIAGPVKGKDFDQVQVQFKNAQNNLEANGFKVINPLDIITETNYFRKAGGMQPLNDNDPKLRRIILAHTVCVMMAQADEVHMLPGWQDSFGATLERDIALRLEIPITYL